MLHHSMNPQIRKGLEASQRCHNLCVQALIDYTLENENKGRAPQPGLMRLLMDCEEVCSMTSGFLLRGSHFHDRACQLCSMICKACAEGCVEAGNMADCLHACLRCAEACDQMVEAMIVCRE
ncbi:hypothetical protein [Actimicrobium antarcticum]|uniref:hypothetical protein n=1 Tax=Actimicrobium antarcticum TaxID=1051899 RepID=UPI0031DE319E